MTVTVRLYGLIYGYRATESPSEGGGTFDSSGAFHGTNSEDDEPVVSHMMHELHSCFRVSGFIY